MFIHRPEYFGITEDESGNSLLGVAEIIIAKHRNGATGDVHLAFKKELAKFSDMENPLGSDFGGMAQTFSSKMNQDEEESVGAGISTNSNFENSGGPNSDTPF